jgi:UDP-perosamine 4-acetyltransferase
MRALYVAGTGSFAAEVAEVARAAGHETVALIELIDPERVGMTIHGLPVVALEPAVPDAAAVIGAGAGRADLAVRLRGAGWAAEAVVHPAAVVGESATVRGGALVFPGAVVAAAAEIGDDALVSRGALIGHHTRLGTAATVNPGANIAGNCDVGAGVFVGMGAVVTNGVSVGPGAVVGAGAVVLRDVGPGERVQGVPAKRYQP